MNFKKYVEVSDTWVDSHYIMGTSTNTITTLPAELYPNAVTATVGLKGNMSQTGSPTPQNPIQPSETGERTGNLCSGTANISKTINSVVITSDAFGRFTVTGVADGSGGRTQKISDNISLSAGSYRVSLTSMITAQLCVNNASGNTFITGLYNEGTFTLNANTTVYFGLNFTQGNTYSDEFAIMLQPSSTDYPFEPYGQYKIPISSANTTTPAYLGEVQSTRQIKQLVLTGEEDWEVHWSSNSLFTFRTITDYMRARIANLKCSHYVGIITVNGYSDVGNLETALYYNTSSPTTSAFYIRDDNISGVTAFKDFLAQQYAAGTPVTVWYVLATPTTGIVNEPIRKIGDYADEVTGITIPTIAGTNSFDVLTTLKPSEVTVNYKGWHPVSSVHERESGAWT